MSDLEARAQTSDTVRVRYKTPDCSVASLSLTSEDSKLTVAIVSMASASAIPLGTAPERIMGAQPDLSKGKLEPLA